MNPAVNDPMGALVVEAVNAWIENMTSRCWGESKTVTELQDASGVVWLDHPDVTNIVSVTTGYPNQTGDDRRVLPADGYYCTKEGRLTLSRGRQTALSPSTLDYLSIKYEYGVDEGDVPADLKLAALGIAAGYYEYVSNGGREVSRAQVGSYTVQYESSGGDGNGALGAAVSRDSRIVRSYALRRV